MLTSLSDITVNAAKSGDYVYTVSNGEVTIQPMKLIYQEGEEFDATGMEVTVYYNNGTSEVVTDYTISGYTSTPGSKIITVTYGEQTATFEIIVKAKPKAGTWKHDGIGWWYHNADGTYPANSWKKIDNVWYYFNASGYIVTGWKAIGGIWYYFNGSGAMASNQWVGNYYLQADGTMATNKWIGNYYVGANGVWIP